MPLNPNGKIDKPALPFPDTAVAAATASSSSKTDGARRNLTPTEQTIHNIWTRLLPSAPSSIPIDESFFDLGGHSILATRLIFEIRKALVTNAPLGLVFSCPTIQLLSSAIDELRGSDFGLANGAKDGASSSTASASTVNGKLAPISSRTNKAPATPISNEYAADAAKIMERLQAKYEAPVQSNSPQTVFLTGATGFLGAFILKDLLSRTNEVAKVICHIRASSVEAALDRLRSSSQARGAWDEDWIISRRIEVVLGDLDKSSIGMSESDWKYVAEQTDAIVHNGAVVHWVYPYNRLRQTNVVSTLNMIALSQQHHTKSLTFISTTAVFETPNYYLRLSDASLARGGRGIEESDTLDGSLTGLSSGYGQSKWVAERLLMEAGRRGLKTSIIRPAYILGDSMSAVTNTDDFVWRLVKGCIQLGLTPDIYNTINLSPVDHVAKIVSLAMLRKTTESLMVYQVTQRPNVRFNDFLAALSTYGYKIERAEYLVWRTKLEQYVMEVGDSALFPLLHYVLDDLPTSTKSPELDDTNTCALLRAAGQEDRMPVDANLMGRYLAWLVKADFLPTPTLQGATPLPEIEGTAIAIGRSTGH